MSLAKRLIAALKTKSCGCYYDDDGGPYGVPHWVLCAKHQKDGK